MRSPRLLALLSVPFLATALVAQSGDGPEAFFIAPKKIFAGSGTSVMVHAFEGSGAAPREAAYQIRLMKDGGTDTVLAEGKTAGNGWASTFIEVPRDAAGLYSLTADVEGVGQLLHIPVTVAEIPVVLVETDKPIYKPGQSIQGRVILLNNGLQPVAGDVALEIRDAKNNKVLRQEMATNAYGIAPFEFAVADEINTGDWRLKATSGQGVADLTVRVEPYVLPRFRVEVEFDKSWFLVDEPISGTVRSSYFFGKTVDGELAVRGRRVEDGEEETYATYSAAMHSGEARFELEPVWSLSGAARVTGTVSLEIEVTDSAGHKEDTKTVVKISTVPFVVRLRTSSPAAKPGLPFEVYVETLDPNGRPISRPVTLIMDAIDDGGGLVTRDERNLIAQGGKATVSLSVPAGVEYLVLEAESVESSHRSWVRLYGPVGYSPSQSFIQLVPARSGPVSVGDDVRFDIAANQPGATYYEVLAGGRSVRSGVAGETIRFQATTSMAPESKIVVYRVFSNNELGSDSYSFQVRPSEGVNLDVSFDAETVEPGAPVKIQVSADAQSMVGVAVVDESVLALSQARLDIARVYREIAASFGGPTDAEIQDDFIDRPHTVGCQDVLSNAGLAIAVSSGVGGEDAMNIPQGQIFFAGGKIQRGVYGLDPLDDAGVGGGDGLAEVERVRQFFPETWVWEPSLLTDTAGQASLELTAPDSITNWKLRAVSTSNAGLGLASGDLVVFQDFFVEPDLPYAVTRGEEIWIPVSVFNYLDSPQSVLLELEPGEGFEILGDAEATVAVEPNSVTGASFPIRATGVGSFPFKLTARGQFKADAVLRSLRVEPEGTRQEEAVNSILKPGERVTLDTSLPVGTVADSEKLVLTVCGSQVAQTINGVEDLVGRPYG